MDKHVCRTSWQFNIALALLVFLLAAGAYIRIQGLENYTFGFDDSLALTEASYSHPSDMLQYNLMRNGHPLMRSIIPFFIKKYTDTPLALRMGSLLAGLSCIIAFYFLGKRCFNSRYAGLLMALFLALSPEHILVSQVIKPYAYLLLFLALSLIYLHKFLEEQKLSALYFFQLFNFLAFNTHHISIISVTAMYMITAYILLRRKKNAAFLHLCFSSFFLYAFFLFYAVTQSKFASPLVEDIAALHVFLTQAIPYYYLPQFSYGAGGEYLWLVLLASGGFLLWLAKKPLIPILFLLCLFFTFLFHMLDIYSLENSRRNMHMLPFIYLCITFALCQMFEYLHRAFPKNHVAIIASCLLLLAGSGAAFGNALASNAYRNDDSYKVWHFPMSVEKEAGIFAILEQAATRKDMVAIPEWYSPLFTRRLGIEKEEKATPLLARLRHNDVVYYYPYKERSGDIIEFFMHFYATRPAGEVDKIFIPVINRVQMFTYREFLDALKKEGIAKILWEGGGEQKGFYIAYVSSSALHAYLEKQPYWQDRAKRNVVKMLEGAPETILDKFWLNLKIIRQKALLFVLSII